VDKIKSLVNELWHLEEAFLRWADDFDRTQRGHLVSMLDLLTEVSSRFTPDISRIADAAASRLASAIQDLRAEVTRALSAEASRLEHLTDTEEEAAEKATLEVAMPTVKSVAPSSRLPRLVRAERDEYLNNLFNDYANGSRGWRRWTGADGTYSVQLNDGRTLWIFSDTLLGPVNPDGSRSPLERDGGTTKLINNSFVVQDGHGLVTVLGGSESRPQSLMPPAADGRLYWAGDGHQTGESVEVVFQDYEERGEWDWKLKRNVVAIFDVESLGRVSGVHELPSSTGIAWGVALHRLEEFIYVYGVEKRGVKKHMHVARTRGDSLLGTWEFYASNETWSAHESDSEPVSDGVADEYSIARVGDSFMLLTQGGSEVLSPDIVGYFSAAPHGPFSGKTVLYTATEGGESGLYKNSNVYIYNAHAHPHIDRGPGAIVMSYNVNSIDLRDNYHVTEICRPRFVTLHFELPDQLDQA
jgi:hypothetical protein